MSDGEQTVRRFLCDQTGFLFVLLMKGRDEMTEKSLQEEFEKKYCLWGDMLYKIAFLYLANSHDVEDILQEVFIKLLYASPDFRSAEHEKAWLIRTTQNKCKDFLRRSSRHEVNIDDYSVAADAGDADTKIDIVQNIIALPGKCKSTVILYYYYGYSVAEISKILKISKSAVKMRLKRSREILKIELEEYRNEI